MKSIGGMFSTSRIVRYGFGIALSGGVAMLLSGAAFAADSSLAPVSVTTDATQSGQSTVAAPVVSVVNASTTTTTSVTSTTTINTGQQTVSNNANATPTDAATPNVAKSVVSDAAQTPAVPTQTTQTAVASATVPAAPTPSEVAAAEIASSVAATYRPRAVWSAPVESTVSSTDALTPVLPVTPSAPKPAPVKSSGLLGQLTSSLAGVTMPLSVRLFTGVPGGLVMLAIILLSVMVLRSLVSVSFGMVLRRSGYTHAARSDLSAFTFAPSQLLGYVAVSDRVT